MSRNYRKEYDNYQGKPDQIANRSSRNSARRKAKKNGYKVKGKDVHIKMVILRIIAVVTSL